MTDIESVTGRTICLQVEPEKNEKAGKKCWEMRSLYPMFLPGQICMVISQPGWKERFKTFVDKKIVELAEETKGLPNGLRIASNWALNALGFEMFLIYLAKLGVIDKTQRGQMEKEYAAIVKSHLQGQSDKLKSESPTEVFFRVIAQKISAGAISVTGLNADGSKSRGRVIGFAKGQSVMILPDVVMEILSSHFRAVGERCPFTKNSLRNALLQGELIMRAQKGRVTKQVREESGRRVRVWDFGLEDFKKNVAVE